MENCIFMFIPGIENYFAGIDGKIYSNLRCGNTKQRYGKTRAMRPHIGKDGYSRITLKQNGKELRKYHHRLVLEAWDQNRDVEKTDCNHINGIKSDNRPENLEWVSRVENMRHAHDVLGRRRNGRGENAFFTKIKRKDAEEMRAMRAKGFLYREIAAKWGMDESWVWRVVNRHAWND